MKNLTKISNPLKSEFERQNEVTNDSLIFDVDKIISNTEKIVSDIEAIKESNERWEALRQDIIEKDVLKLKPMVDKLGLDISSSTGHIAISLKPNSRFSIIIDYVFSKNRFGGNVLKIDETKSLYIKKAGCSNIFGSIEDFVNDSIFKGAINDLYQLTQII
jgi:hypothetical protein